MAKSSRNGELPEDLPKGMHAFKVLKTTIKDSLCDYCEVGEMAVLDKKLATHYLKLEMIQVELPDFDDGDTNAGAKQSDQTAAAAGAGGGQVKP